ncbi:MAG: hypothetical protein AAFS10_03405 [Myxococcota bacterium]
MGYYMRYITTTSNIPTLDAIRSSLQTMDTHYRLTSVEPSEMSAELFFDEAIVGELDINMRGDGLFDEEIKELRDFVEHDAIGDRAPVLAALTEATAIIAVRVLWGERDTETTMALLDPLWSWLLEHYSGLLQADSEGYYDGSGLILEVS